MTASRRQNALALIAAQRLAPMQLQMASQRGEREAASAKAGLDALSTLASTGSSLVQAYPKLAAEEAQGLAAAHVAGAQGVTGDELSRLAGAAEGARPAGSPEGPLTAQEASEQAGIAAAKAQGVTMPTPTTSLGYRQTPGEQARTQLADLDPVPSGGDPLSSIMAAHENYVRGRARALAAPAVAREIDTNRTEAESKALAASTRAQDVAFKQGDAGRGERKLDIEAATATATQGLTGRKLDLEAATAKATHDLAAATLGLTAETRRETAAARDRAQTETERNNAAMNSIAALNADSNRARAEAAKAAAAARPEGVNAPPDVRKSITDGARGIKDLQSVSDAFHALHKEDVGIAGFFDTLGNTLAQHVPLFTANPRLTKAYQKFADIRNRLSHEEFGAAFSPTEQARFADQFPAWQNLDDETFLVRIDGMLDQAKGNYSTYYNTVNKGGLIRGKLPESLSVGRVLSDGVPDLSSEVEDAAQFQ